MKFFSQQHQEQTNNQLESLKENEPSHNEGKVTKSLRKSWTLRLLTKVAALALLNFVLTGGFAVARAASDQDKDLVLMNHNGSSLLIENIEQQEPKTLSKPEYYNGRRLDVYINDLGIEEKTVEVQLTEKQKATAQALYLDVFTDEQVRNGVSIFLLFLIIYCFFGIQLATQNYVNPAIDIIKKKGVLGSETMNVTLLAMSNSLAESFIILNSIFFGVSDIGISTVCQQAAFYALINQGMFYLVVEEGTFIDWWIISRETAFLLMYLSIISYFLYGNQVKMWSAVMLFVLYIVHIVLMKYSNKYEVALKKALANYMELNELDKIARKRKEIWRYHQSCKSQAVSIEMLCQVQFNLIGNYIVFEKTGVRKKLDPIICVKLGEEQFAEKDDKALMSRLNFKRAVTKIIIKLQAYRFNQQIINTQMARQHLGIVLPQMPEMDAHDLSAYGNSYYSEDDCDNRSMQSQTDGESQVFQLDVDHQSVAMDVDAPPIDSDIDAPPVDPAIIRRQEEANRNKPSTAEQRQIQNFTPRNANGKQTFSPRPEIRKEAAAFRTEKEKEDQYNVDMMFQHIDSEEDEFEEYREHPQPVQLPQSAIYDMILNSAKAGWKHPLTWPSSTRSRISFMVKFPHIIMQHVSVPNAMATGKENFYPLTLLMATFWVWFYSYMIVWCTFVITVAYDWKFSILPMIIYPFGIMLRDLKKLEDMRAVTAVFKTKCKDQRLGLAETFSGPIFQITGLMGFAWIMYISVKGPLSFINESIQYQMPLLLFNILVKYVGMIMNGYKTSKRMFYINVINYAVFLVCVVVIDYRIEFFGA